LSALNRRGPRFSLDDVRDGKNPIRIRINQIKEILNQDPVTKMVNRRKLRWSAAPNCEGQQQKALASMGKMSRGVTEG
jgi:hypothetical protein